MMMIYEMKLRCFVLLRKKKSAKQCLRQLKKFYKNREDGDAETKKFTELISNIKNISLDDGEEVKTILKCSNIGCEKLESKTGEFKLCTQCRVAYYCSRKCQKQHWKREHKQFCIRVEDEAQN